MIPEKWNVTLETFVPSDNKEMKEKYAKVGGTCGPSTIATSEKITVHEVIARWKGIGESTFRGFSPIKDLKETLKEFGYSFVYVRAHKSKVFPIPRTETAILRIQWLDGNGKEYYWAAAGSHTHYVLMKKLDGDWWIFCNDCLWFKRDSEVGRGYLEGRGFVSSYLELSKTRPLEVEA